MQGISDYGSGNPEAVRAAIFSCLPAGAIVPGTDVLAIRRVATEASTLSTGGVASPALVATPYVQGGLVPDGSGGNKQKTQVVVALPANPLLTTFPAKGKDAVLELLGLMASLYDPRPLAPLHCPDLLHQPVQRAGADLPNRQYAGADPQAYRVGGGAGFPTTAEVIAEGIEDLQVDYGVNTNATGAYLDGSANTYVQCTPASSTTYETNCLWQEVVSAKIYLLARNVDRSLDYTDTRRYRLGLRDASSPTAVKNDNYKRHLYSGVVRLNNVGMNRECTPTSTDPC